MRAKARGDFGSKVGKYEPLGTNALEFKADNKMKRKQARPVL